MADVQAGEPPLNMQQRAFHWGRVAHAVVAFPCLAHRSAQAPQADAAHRNRFHDGDAKLGCKRRHELSIIAKKVWLLARHYQAAAVVTERLRFSPKDYRRGRRFNRLVNQVWMRRGFLEPFERRLLVHSIPVLEVDPAYSSKIGNVLWAGQLRIPDPACAAVEVGRRALFPVKFPLLSGKL